MRDVALPSRGASWTYSDHATAWQCEAPAGSEEERRVPLHTGPIQRGFANRSYCCFHLSALRTWLAIKLTRGEGRSLSNTSNQ